MPLVARGDEVGAAREGCGQHVIVGVVSSAALTGMPLTARSLDLVGHLVLGEGRQVQRIKALQALGEPCAAAARSSLAARNSTKSTTSA
ncbi:MAG: hypothetical protein ABI574_18135 [Burkholderiales bacterium]